MEGLLSLDSWIFVGWLMIAPQAAWRGTNRAAGAMR